MIARSHLYVPGDKPEVLAKALARDADALIVDLEDAVPLAGKAAARAGVAEWLRAVPVEEPTEIWVRVNPGELGLLDLQALAPYPAITGFCLAKTENVDEVRAVGDLLEAAGSSAAITPLLESATAVLRIQEIAAAPRVRRLQVGEADLRAEIGVELSADETELLWVRSQVVMVSAALGLEPPIGPVTTDFRDLETLRTSTEALRRLGFRGRACIHPAQVPVVNDVFTPSPEEVARARRLVEAYDAAVATGSGVLVGDDGRMIDEAVVRAARRVLGGS